MSNNNLPVAVYDQPMPTNNQFDFISKLPPDQQTQIIIEYQRFESALAIENCRSNNSFMVADREHQNKFAQMQYQANQDDQREAMKGRNAVALADKEHANRMEQMDIELQNQKALAEHNTELSVITKLMEEDSKVRASLLARMENSHKELDKEFNTLCESLIRENQAQRQHKRNVAQLHAEWEMKNEIQGI